jgi:lactoylglutathione lyase
MKLNHLNLPTGEVRAAADFFVKYFGFQQIATRAPEAFALLHDEAGFSLLLSNFDRKTKPTYPDGFHFGLVLDTREQVNEVYGRLRADGFASEPPSEMHGSWTFYFISPGGFNVEVQCFR